MVLKKYRPTTPSQRFLILNKREDIAKDNSPERSLITPCHRPKGRNCYGRITSRRRGGGHKQLYRIIDFKRDKKDIPAFVQRIEYDPNRTANIALLAYIDGEKRYILAPKNLKVGDQVVSTNKSVDEYTIGMCLPLHCIPPGTAVHAVELLPGKGAQIARTAGSCARLVALDGDYATLKMPSKEVRKVHVNCLATIGELGNADHMNQSLGKAGRNRWLGKRPRVRGIAMNPVDHPMGGGQGKTSGGGHPVSPWGQLSKGKPTRKRSKWTNNKIITRCNGRKMKKV